MTSESNDEIPRRQWRDRSHADDKGIAIELLTGILTGENEAVRRAIRTVRRSHAEATGLMIALSGIAVTLLRFIGDRTETEAIDVLREIAPDLQAEGFAMDAELGPPLPGSAYLATQDPPTLQFLVGETLKSLASIDDGIGQLLSPEDEVADNLRRSEGDDDWPVPARRLMWEVVLLVNEAADYFRGEIDWQEDRG